MQASKTIEALAKVRPHGTTWPSEAALRLAIEAALRNLGIRFLCRPASAAGVTELLVDSAPNLLMVISLSGDWQKIVAAAAQICIDQKALPLARPVIVLGSPPSPVALKDALAQLDFILIECFGPITCPGGA